MNVNVVCDQCEYTADTKKTLERHYKSSHQGMKHKCQICGFQASKKGLQSHQQIDHAGKRFQCQECDFQSSRTCHIRKHE